MSGCSERWTAAVVFLALFVCVTSPLPAGPLPATGVLDALAEPDGSTVSLKAVSVQKMASDPPHIVVSDPWAGDIRLIVLLPALQSCGAKVYTSLWEDYNGDLWTTRYEGLHVGGANEPTSYPASLPPDQRYPLQLLRTQVLANWP